MADVDRLVDLLDVLLTNPQVGDSLKYDGTKWVNDVGISMPVMSDHLIAFFRKTNQSGDPATGFHRMLYADLNGLASPNPIVKGTDLSIVNLGDRMKFHTVGGGSFMLAVTISLFLNANPNDGTTRWITIYGTSTSNASLGIDKNVPMLHGLEVDDGAVCQGPYLDLPPDTTFGELQLSPLVGAVGDTFLFEIAAAVWKIAT